MSAVDSVRESYAEARDGLLDRVEPAEGAFVVGVGAFLFTWVGAQGEGSLTLAGILGGFTYLLTRSALENYHEDLGVDVNPETRHVEGEVIQVLTPDEFGEFAVREDLERRARRRDERLVVVETRGLEHPVAQVVSRTFLARMFDGLLAYLTGGAVVLRETETVLLEDAPVEGDHVALRAQEATVEVVLDAVEPLPDPGVHPRERAFPDGYQADVSAAAEDGGRP